MAEKDEKKQPKKKKGLHKPKLVSQIQQIYKYTRADDPQLPYWCIGAFVLPLIALIILGIVFKWNILIWIMMTITALMGGLLLMTIVLTRRADKVGYKRLEGRPGAAVSVLGNISKAGFYFPEQPVWIDPRTKDAIWQGTSYAGIYLLGEGDPARVTRAMDRQERAIKGVTAGSRIPVYRLLVGQGEGQVKLKDLRRAVIKQKSYVPIKHKTKFWDKVHPRERFILTKTELATLNDRLRTLQAKSGFGIPKGIDPTRPQKISRRAMRGR